jgi:glutathione S-transferase
VGDKDFLGGKRPNRADLTVFGVLRAVPNSDTFKATIHDSRIMPWWQRMVETVGESSRLEEMPDL